MAVAKKSVDYCVELDSLLGIVNGLVLDAVAKKPLADAVAKAVPVLLGALTGLSELGEELKNHKALDMTIAAKLIDLKAALVPDLP
jgi:hypothetical protein